MITDQERMNAFWAITKEMDLIVQNPVVHLYVPEIVQRLNQGSAGVVIVAPTIDLEGRPVLKSIWHSMANTMPQHSLKVYPLFAQDAQIHETFARVVSDCKWAIYQCPTHTITLNMDAGETLRYKACFLIHELGHAWENLTEGLAFSDQVHPRHKRVLQESKMRIFDCKLMLALGGPQYQAEVDRAVYWIRKHDREFQKKHERPDYFRGKGAALSLCLGPPLNPQSEGYRDELFMLYCLFAAIDRSQKTLDATAIRCRLMEDRFSYMIDI